MVFENVLSIAQHVCAAQMASVVCNRKLARKETPDLANLGKLCARARD